MLAQIIPISLPLTRSQVHPIHASVCGFLNRPLKAKLIPVVFEWGIRDTFFKSVVIICSINYVIFCAIGHRHTHAFFL